MWNALGRLLVKFSDQTYVVCVWRSRFVDVCSCSRLGTPLNVKRAHLWVTSASFVYQSAESPSGPHSSSKGRTSAARARLGIFEAFSLSHREREFVWVAFNYLPVKNVGKRIRTWSGRYRRKARQRKTVSHWIKLVSDLYVLRSIVFISCWRFMEWNRLSSLTSKITAARFVFFFFFSSFFTAVLTLCCTLTLCYLIVWYNGAATVVQSLHASFFIYSSISLTCIICWVSNHTLNF